jgi:hypothetical protein
MAFSGVWVEAKYFRFWGHWKGLAFNEQKK